MKLRAALLVLTIGTGGSSPLMAGLDDGTRAMRDGRYNEAFRQWKPLAERGNVDAQASIAVMYHAGRGAPRDFRQAVEWYRKAAHQGNVAAQANLALMYSRGLGVAADMVMAYVWYELAATGGQARHRDVAKQLAGQLSPGQLQKARRLAAQYREKYVPSHRRGARDPAG